MMDLIAFGGETWVRVGWPVWVLGGILALHAGWLCGIAVVDFVRTLLVFRA